MPLWPEVEKASWGELRITIPMDNKGGEFVSAFVALANKRWGSRAS